MSYRLIALDDGEEMISSAMATKDQALGFARDLHRDGLKILRIVSSDGEVVADADEVAEWISKAKPAAGEKRRSAR